MSKQDDKFVLPSAMLPASDSVPEKVKTFAEITHDTDMGQKVRVERDAKLTGDIAKEAGSNLLTIGQFLAESDHSIKHCKYLGSAAVHVYQSEMLGEVFFFTQVNTLCNMNEMIASNAMSELNKRGMEYYSRRIPKKRSGW